MKRVKHYDGRLLVKVTGLPFPLMLSVFSLYWKSELPFIGSGGKCCCCKPNDARQCVIIVYDLVLPR